MVIHLQRGNCSCFGDNLNQKGLGGESMGCICSKESPEPEKVDESEKAKEFDNSSVQLVAPTPIKREDFIVEVRGGGQSVGLVGFLSRQTSQTNGGSVQVRKAKNGSFVDEENKARNRERRGKDHNQKLEKKDVRVNGKLQQMSRLVSFPNAPEGGQVLAGWPSWLTSVAGDAIKGWVPRRADSFEKLDKIGQGTYSSVYKARDLETGKIVALKKVRFVNMDPESVRFMAREICILRELDHPNVMKLEGLVTSRMSCSLYLVFEYMEHDLAGLMATPGIKFTEPQIKCFMQQLFSGLEHCHSRGVLHRDIKGSNLLIDSNGVLKIGDFGLATFFKPDQKQPLTSRVVTLWYRAPELLLGSTKYGAAIDLWSTGCILAELFVGKPIMPGRTEVEQMHKIFKLCGSPCEDYWQRTKFPHATSFKPHHPYKRCLVEAFRNFPSSALALVDKLLAIKPEERGSVNSALISEFFQTDPLPCDPSSLPKYPPSKEFDAKRRNEEARRQKVEAVKGRGPESVRRGSRETILVPTPELNAEEDVALLGQSNPKTSSHKLNVRDDGGTGIPMEPPRRTSRNGLSHSNSMIHPNVLGSSWNKPGKPTRSDEESLLQRLQKPREVEDLSNSSLEKDQSLPEKDSNMGFGPKKNRMHYSGPLLAPGRNMEDMLKEHERQVQQAVRKARLDKSRTNKSYSTYLQRYIS